MSEVCSWGLDTNHDTKERFMMFTNYPKQPNQQEIDHLYETHKVDHSILSNMLSSEHPIHNNRTAFMDYGMEELLRYGQPFAVLLQWAEQRIRSEVFCLKPTRPLVEVEKITVEALREKLIDPLHRAIEDSHRMHPVVGGVEYESYQGPICGNPCLIMNKMAQTDLRVAGAIDKGTDQLFGYPVFIVEGGERSEVMLFSGHSIYYSNKIPDSFFDEATFGGANIHKIGPHVMEIIRRISPMRVATQVVLHSNFGLEPRYRALIWKMVTKS